MVVVVTGLAQWPNVFTRVGGDELIREMLVDCRVRGVDGVLCLERGEGMGKLVGLLASGILIKLLLTLVSHASDMINLRLLSAQKFRRA